MPQTHHKDAYVGIYRLSSHVAMCLCSPLSLQAKWRSHELRSDQTGPITQVTSLALEGDQKDTSIVMVLREGGVISGWHLREEDATQGQTGLAHHIEGITSTHLGDQTFVQTEDGNLSCIALASGPTGATLFVGDTNGHVRKWDVSLGASASENFLDKKREVQ